MTLIKYTIKTILVLLAIEIVLAQYINTSPRPRLSRHQYELFPYLQPPAPMGNYKFPNYNIRGEWQQQHQARQQYQPRQPQSQPQPQPNYTAPKNDLSFMQKFVRWFGYGGGTNSSASPTLKVKQNEQQQQSKQHRNNFYPSQNGQYRNNYKTPEIQSVLPNQQPIEWPSATALKNNGEILTVKGKGKCLPCNQIPWIPIFPFYQTPILINKHNNNAGGGDPRNHLTPNLTTEISGDLPHDVETIPSITSTTTIIRPSTPVTGLTTSSSSSTTTTTTTQLPYDTEKLISLSTVQPNNFYNSHQPFMTGPLLGPLLAPIPVPNLSATPIPPLFDAKSFLYNPYGNSFLRPPFNKASESKSQHQNYKIDAVPDSSSKFSPVVATPTPGFTTTQTPPTPLPKFGKIESFPSHLYKDLEITSDTDIEVIKSIPVAHFSTTVLQYPNSNGQIVHQQQSYGSNLGSIKHDIKVLNTIINESIGNEPITADDSNLAASSNQNFTVGSEIRFVRPETTTMREYFYDEDFGETSSHPKTVDAAAPVPDQIIYGRPSGIENTVSIPTSFAIDSASATNNNFETRVKNEEEENRENSNSEFGTTNRFSKSSDVFNSIPSASGAVESTASPPIQTTVYDDTKKKSKQIQIIIPYTMDHQKPGQYVTVNYDNWNVRNSYQNDDYAHGESKVLYQTNKPEVVVEKKNPKYITKILATNLRELLKKEIKKSPKNTISSESAEKNTFFIDQAKLQMNIDDWTEQEFSSSNMEQRASTISFLVPSKIIPNEYLTTTPSSIETTTFLPQSQLDDTSDEYYRDQSEEVSTEKVNSVDNDSKKKSSRVENSLWNQLGVTISPITYEKVHVVTPQKLNAVNSDNIKHAGSSAATTFRTVELNYRDDNQFKSPRFVVRPTPGSPTKGRFLNDLSQIKSTLAYSINNLETTPASARTSGVGHQQTLLKPKLFGYMNYFSPLSALIEKEDEELSEKQRIQIVTPLSFIRRNNLDSADDNVSN